MWLAITSWLIAATISIHCYINVVCHEIGSLGYIFNFTMILAGTMNVSAGIFGKILLSNSFQQDAKQIKAIWQGVRL